MRQLSQERLQRLGWSQLSRVRRIWAKPGCQ